VLSDTVYFIQAMISTRTAPGHLALPYASSPGYAEWNYLIQTNVLTKGCFIKLGNYNAQRIKDKKCGASLRIRSIVANGVQDPYHH
jgi:hypothetical protein